jgi:hypothetical protein
MDLFLLEVLIPCRSSPGGPVLLTSVENVADDL